MSRARMSRLVLATADVDFEQRVRDAFDGELNGPLRYWRDDMLVDPADAVRELGGRGVEVVALGPDMPAEHALALATAFDHDRPDISVVIIAPPSTELLQSALRAGARDVIAPDIAPADLRAAIEQAFDTATAPPPGVRRRRRRQRRRRPRPRDHGAVPEGRRRQDHGLDATSPSRSAQVAPGEVVIVDLDLQFGDVAERPRPAPGAHLRRRGALARHARRDHAQGLPHRRTRRTCSCCARRRRRPRPTTSPSSRSSGCSSCSSQSFRYVVIDTASGLDEHTLAALEYATDLVLDLGHRRPEHPGDGEGDRGAAGRSASRSTSGTSCSTGPTPAPGSPSPRSSGPSASTSTSRSRARGRCRCR